MSEKAKRRCRNCIFWVWHANLSGLDDDLKEREIQDHDTGDCRANTPTVPMYVMAEGENPALNLPAIWPTTLARDFCGGHKGRSEFKEKSA